MANIVTIPNTFADKSGSIALALLDNNFSTLANAVNGIGNGTTSFSNVSITGGTVTNATVSGLAADILVSDGGTGVGTITANAVVLGNGTGAIKTVTPGTSGNVLSSDGTVWISQAVATSGFTNINVFTSNATFTIPAGVTKIKVTVVGGGGGGNSGNAGGGGGGGAAIKIITGLTPGANVTVTVGSGGAASTAGGNSSFGAYCSATGGSPGANPNGGAGGLGSGGDLNIGGQGGGGGGATNATYVGTGGSSILGGGGYGNINAGSGAGRPYGGGGGGTGSLGAAGVVIVEY
jgi:hypothetical protein